MRNWVSTRIRISMLGRYWVYSNSCAMCRCSEIHIPLLMHGPRTTYHVHQMSSSRRAARRAYWLGEFEFTLIHQIKSSCAVRYPVFPLSCCLRIFIPFSLPQHVCVRCASSARQRCSIRAVLNLTRHNSGIKQIDADICPSVIHEQKCRRPDTSFKQHKHWCESWASGESNSLK